MFEFLLFLAACAAIAVLAVNIQKSAFTPKLKPIKIEREKTEQKPIKQPKRPY